MLKENTIHEISDAEIDDILFKVYKLESVVSHWNNDNRDQRVKNRAMFYRELSDIINKIKSIN